MDIKEYRLLYEYALRLQPDVTEMEFRELYAVSVKKGIVVLPEVQGY